jgi:hypothetical protein
LAQLRLKQSLIDANLIVMMNDKNYNFRSKPRLKKEGLGNKKVLFLVGFILLGIYGPLVIEYFKPYTFSPNDPLCELSHLDLKGCR